MRLPGTVVALVALAAGTRATECTKSIVTVVSTVTEVSTEVSVSTCYVTVPTTVHEVSTALRWTTEFVTSTTTTTYETSYPVPTTVLVNCTPRSGVAAPTGYDIEPDERTPEHPNECDTVIFTSWRTTTTTEHITVVRPTTVLTTIATTVDNTVTAPGETVTAPGETVTGPVETFTVPAETVTLPAETLVTTVTDELPPRTVTVTEDGEIVTTALPAETITTVATIVVPPTTVTVPDTTVQVLTVFDVTVCPEPTGTYQRLAPDSNLLFGCEPGYVCNPTKPDGCNVWPGPPSQDFVCAPGDCIPAPPVQTVTWEEGTIGHYPPVEGYFDLNPEVFGLSYNIFAYEVQERVGDGYTTTVTTNNRHSPATYAAWARPSADVVRREQRYSFAKFSKRQGTPVDCYTPCNNAYRIASYEGVDDALCVEGGQFLVDYERCVACVEGTPSQDSIWDYVLPQFQSFIGVCNTDGATPPPGNSTSTFSIPDAVSSDPNVETSSQVAPSSSGFTPITTTDLSSFISSDSVSSIPSETSTSEAATVTSETTSTSEVTSAPANTTTIIESFTSISVELPSTSPNGTAPSSSSSSPPGVPTVVAPGAAPRVATGSTLLATLFAMIAFLLMA